MSSKMRSGFFWRANSMPSAPSLAAATSWPKASSRYTTSCRLVGLSSITRMRAVMVPFCVGAAPLLASAGFLHRHESLSQGQRNREPASFPVFAFERNAAPDHERELLADVQPQTGTFVGARRGVVHLHECLEKFRLVLLANSQSRIRDRDLRSEQTVFFSLMKCQPYRALLRELDRIVGQINENLGQGAAVGADVDLVIGKRDFEL